MAWEYTQRFWTVQSDFWTSRPDAQAKAQKLKIKDKPGIRTFAYLNDGSQWIQRKPGEAGLVRIDPQLRIDMLKMINDLAPMLMSAYDLHFSTFARRAYDRWPVDTGLSKAMLELRYETYNDATELRAKLVSRAPYTPYINGSPFMNLIDRPGFYAAQDIAAEVQKEFQRYG